MDNYQNSKIYKLWSDESDMLYIGSTTSPLHKRLWKHRYDIKQGTSNTFIAMRNHTNIKIELVEDFPCISKDELLAREGYYIRLNKDALLNKIIPGRTWKEYYSDNKEHIKNYSREHYVTNRDKINEYREANRETILKQKKTHREKHKEKIREYQKQYRAKKKIEKITSASASLSSP